MSAAVIGVLLIALTSLIVTRVATVALTLTGLSRETARFQARSALSGAGYTTSESESIVNHPVRRRIVMTLMFMGSVWLVSLMATLSAAIIKSDGVVGVSLSGGVLVAGLLGIYYLASSKWFDKALTPIMRRALRRFTDIEVRDYAALLQVAGDYAVMELLVEESDWLAEKSLKELRLPDEGVLVLGIQRRGEGYVGAPEGDTIVHANETLELYGTRQRLAELDSRDSVTGEIRHETATQEQERLARERRASKRGRVRRPRRSPSAADGPTEDELDAYDR